MTQLKERLLTTGMFKDCEFLDRYIEVLKTKQLHNRIKYETEKHHIIPAFYFRAFNTDIDNSSDNLVILYNKDHILAHLYLALCVTDTFSDAASHAAGRVITGHQGSYPNIESAIDVLDFELLQQIATQRRIASSAALENSKKNKGKIWINNGKINCMIDPLLLDEWILRGYKKGRLPLPQEGIEKMRRSRTGQKYSEESAKLKRDHTRETLFKRYGVYGINTSSKEKSEAIRRTVNKYYETHTHMSKGKIAVFNIETKQTKYIYPEQLEEYIFLGWRKGRK